MHISALEWVLLIVFGLSILISLVTILARFKDKLKLKLMPPKDGKVDWYELYEKAKKSGIPDKVINFMNSRKNK